MTLCGMLCNSRHCIVLPSGYSPACVITDGFIPVGISPLSFGCGGIVGVFSIFQFCLIFIYLVIIYFLLRILHLK